MTTEEMIITAVVFVAAVYYIYHSLFKKKGCSSCPSGKDKCSCED